MLRGITPAPSRRRNTSRTALLFVGYTARESWLRIESNIVTDKTKVDIVTE